MTTEHSTYTHESGAQETVMLIRGPATPHGHALLTIDCSDGSGADCYVNTAWLRDRLDDLGAGTITDEMVDRAHRSLISHHGYGRILRSQVCEALTEALTEPPARPEGAEDIEVLLYDMGVDERRGEVADYIAARITDPTRKDTP